MSWFLSWCYIFIRMVDWFSYKFLPLKNHYPWVKHASWSIVHIRRKGHLYTHPQNYLWAETRAMISNHWTNRSRIELRASMVFRLSTMQGKWGPPLRFQLSWDLPGKERTAVSSSLSKTAKSKYLGRKHLQCQI